MMAATATLRELDAYAKARDLSVRLSISPAVAEKNKPTRLAYLALYDKRGAEGEELEGVFVAPKKPLDEAAALLLELVTRTPTPED
jgi:hypothetical protein